MVRKRQNDRVFGACKKEIPSSRLYHETSRFTKKVMVSAGVSWNGKTDIHLIDTNKTKVNSESYIKLLDDGLLPDCRRLYPATVSGLYVPTGWGPLPYTSNATQTDLEQVVPHFIKKDDWPPQSPDLTPWITLFGIPSLKRSTKDAHKNSQRTN